MALRTMDERLTQGQRVDELNKHPWRRRAPIEQRQTTITGMASRPDGFLVLRGEVDKGRASGWILPEPRPSSHNQPGSHNLVLGIPRAQSHQMPHRALNDEQRQESHLAPKRQGTLPTLAEQTVSFPRVRQPQDDQVQREPAKSCPSDPVPSTVPNPTRDRTRGQDNAHSPNSY